MRLLFVICIQMTIRSKLLKKLGRKFLSTKKLKAIVLGETPWVFINDTLLSMGGRLTVNDGIESYECEVVEIEKDSVLIRCREAEITLKFVQTVE